MSSGPGQIVVLRGAQEAEAVRQALEHALGEDQSGGLGLRLEDLEDELLLAQARGALDPEVLGGRGELGDRHLLERADVEHLLAVAVRAVAGRHGLRPYVERQFKGRSVGAFGMFFLPLLLRRGLLREKFCDGFPEFTDTLPCLGGDGQDRRRFSDLQRVGDLLHTPDALSSFHVVDLGGDGQRSQSQPCKVLSSLLVESRRADSRVHQVNHDALRMRGPQVVVDDLGPLAPGLLGGLRVAEAREIDEVEGAVDPEVVDQLGPAGSGARARQLPAQKPVQQARLADIRAPGEGDLRQARRA